MSVRDDVAALYADTFLTVPVAYNGTTVRGYFDSAAVMRVDESTGMALQGLGTTLRVKAGAWSPMPTPDATVRIGRESALTLTTATSTVYRVREVLPDGDGLETVLVLVPS